ncbi:MAG: diguanylate cyclase [Planctomycetota bacterium]
MPILKIHSAARLLAISDSDATRSMLPIPFFSRQRFKHGVALVLLILLAMTVVTSLQIREALRGIERSAVNRGRTVAAAVAPLVVPMFDQGKTEDLKRYFFRVEDERDIDYIQVIDANGRVIIGNPPRTGERPAKPQPKGWLMQLENRIKLDREAISVLWPNRETGVDIFVALLDQPSLATPDMVENAMHLRIGINFNDVAQKDIPRTIRRMLYLTLVVTAIMLLLVFMWLAYLLRPVRELHRGLRAVSGGNLEYQVPIYSQDEMGRLTQAFNTTTARLRTAFQRIEELATHDPLTNLPNRRMFDERLAIEVARSHRYGRSFGLLIMDLDKFKNINDQYGHSAGDEVLRVVAKVIEANVRETDLPARIGGDEFAVILPESQSREIQICAEKLRLAVEQMELLPKYGLPPGAHITISIGAADSIGSLTTPKRIIAGADAALYQAKSRGHNCVNMDSSCI